MAASRPRLTREDLDEAQRRLYDAVVSGPRAASGALAGPDGSLRGPFDAMLLAPAVGTPLQELGAALRYRGVLPARRREIATLTVAHRCDSAYEWRTHSGHGRAAGLTQEEIDSLRTPSPRLADAADRVVVRAAHALLDEGALPDDVADDATRLLGTDQLFELVVLVGYYRLLAGVLAVFGWAD
ncbi:carboxymuconolactone decarboxylase family protein [Actinomycetospora sp. TBRC 11914]|uniref:carboxymuconolactone decarboxylase family protein n=1 Tax=Actinomycetospora sp. TBRC 11914 TaxID=2729387 RepID=UPI00145E583A|nr:carboxymuconolactone decarboxylase family protein [Actinomycetospora sp. TBRC 11914]NMO89485.1 carboxymuconolactone decarboxylase family protein [Actinomycetospora sp. TBRC 11914]